MYTITSRVHVYKIRTIVYAVQAYDSKMKFSAKNEELTEIVHAQRDIFRLVSKLSDNRMKELGY